MKKKDGLKTTTRKNILTGRTRTVTKNGNNKNVVVTDKSGTVRKEKTKMKTGTVKLTETKKYKKDGTIKSHSRVKRKKVHVTGHGVVSKRTKTNMLKKK